VILTKLSITDFGVFRGTHAIDLAPKSHRPIILFGGKNGAGKSTVLEALRLCLYGTGALGTISKDQYLRFLEGKIHKNPNALIQPTFASIQIHFQYSHADGLVSYAVMRSWERRASGKVSESLAIERNGQALTDIESDHWQDFLRELIPPGVSQLFFFDGEKIQHLAEDSTDQQALAEAVKSLLGVDIVERLQADLSIYRTRLSKPDHDNADVSEIRRLGRAIAQLHQKLNGARKERERLEERNRHISDTLQKAESSFAERGGAFARNRDTLIQQEAMLKQRVSQLEDNIREQCAGLLPFALVPYLCKKLSRQLAVEELLTRTRVGQALLLKAKKDLEQQLSPSTLFSNIESLSAAAKAQISSRIDSALRTSLDAKQPESTVIIHQLSEADSRLLSAWIAHATNEIPTALRAVTDELENTHRQLQKTIEAVRKIPADDVLRPVLTEIHRLNERLAKATTEAMLKDARIKEVELQLADLQRRQARLTQKLSAGAKASAKLTILPRVEKALDEYRLRLIDKKIAELQRIVTECFNLLCRKKDALRTIKIDTHDFSISLCDRNGHPIPKAQLSAGEKQIYAISMLWALGRASGRPLPVIIDTPLARLDSDHRRLLVEHYFPHASHQVILLSTDTEVDQFYFDLLKPTVAHAHRLEYDELDSATTVSQGYFWRETNEAHKAAAV
jgi:DNA sulfur modification protein DndD